MKCKGNSAALVKAKMPQVLAVMIAIVLGRLCLVRAESSIAVDRGLLGRHNLQNTRWRPMFTKRKSKSPKVEALLAEGTLNPTPAQVRDPKFREHEFFDPRDLVQVKYELLRRVSVENTSVVAATQEYGVSRPTYYQTKAHFDQAGLAGLVPQKRGPRGPHKLQGEVWAFVQQQLVAGKPVRARELAKQIRQQFDLNIHPRTIERAVAGKKTPR